MPNKAAVRLWGKKHDNTLPCIYLPTYLLDLQQVSVVLQRLEYLQ